jgi:phosphatidylglycerophosphatase A
LRLEAAPTNLTGVRQQVIDFKQKAIIFLATGGWIGFSPVAPGTFGSLAALPLCLLISSMRIGPALIVVVALIMVSTWIAHAAEKIEAQKDPSQVVLDEICGMAIALFALPFTPFFIIGGFALFRVFDILKPFPIQWVDKKVPGGLGIMLDDIVAGIFANGVMRVGIYLL